MKQQSTKTIALFMLIGVIAMHTGGSHALAQRRAPREPPRSQAAPNADQARLRINRQLETLEHQEQRLRTALKMLDDGKSPRQIQQFLSEDGPDRRPQRPQRQRDRPQRQRAPDGDTNPDEALSALADLNPRLHERLQRLKERDPDRYDREIRRLAPRLAPMARQRRAHPDQWEERVQRFQSEQHARRLARQASMATDDDVRQARIDELRELIDQQFTHRERIHEMEIERAEHNISDQKRRLENARLNRPQLLTERVEEILKRAAQDELFDDHPPRDRR